MKKILIKHYFCPSSCTVHNMGKKTFYNQTYNYFFLIEDNEIHDNPDVASVEFALMVQREAIRQIQRWFFEDTAHYFHSHITKEIIVSSHFYPHSNNSTVPNLIFYSHSHKKKKRKLVHSLVQYFSTWVPRNLEVPPIPCWVPENAIIIIIWSI